MIVGPTTFIVGAPKTGTTALANHLAGHPAVFVSNPKEPFYLSENELPGLAAQHELASDADYLALFADGAGQPVRIDASTTTLRSPAAIERAEHLTDGQARYIVGLRKPTRLAHAFHSEQVFQLNEPETDFERAWRRREPAGTGPYAHFLDYREVARVGSQLEELLTLVDRRRVYVYVQEELASEPARLAREVLAFLDLPDDGRETIERVNGNRRHRFPALAAAVLNPPPMLAGPVRALRARLNASDHPLVAALKSRLRPPVARADLEPAFAVELDEFFALEVDRVEAALGRRVEVWHR